MKLVIVDDIAVNRKLLRVTLEAEGHTVLEAADGVEALCVLSRERVDGVISDILMPGMDGYRLCNEIRADQQLRNLPFVFYTSSFCSPVDEQMAHIVGADRYLTKPASVTAILNAINEAVAMQHTPPLSGAAPEIEVLKAYTDRLVTKLKEKNIELESELRMSAVSIDVGAALMHGRTLPEIFRRCCDALVRHLDLASVAVWTHNEPKKALEWQSGAGLGVDFGECHTPVPVGQFRIGLVAEQRKPHVVDNSDDGDNAETCVPGQEFMFPEAPGSFAGYPLVVGERLLGVMSLFARDSFSGAALDKIAHIADSIALGIDRKRSEDELRNALAEKTTLLQEVHHRVKNNLQVICSLLSMQIGCSAVDLSTGPLNDALARVLAVSLVHEHIYRSDSLGDIDFGEYIRGLSASVFAAYCIDQSRIGMELSVEPIRLNVDHAVPCGLILNELLSNTLKHAFNDGRRGVIRISLRSVNGFVELTVSDNGVGFAPDFQWAESRSLGMKVVRTLARQLRGDLTMNGQHGASFRVSWPLPDTELFQAVFSSSSKQTATFPHSPEAISVYASPA